MYSWWYLAVSVCLLITAPESGALDPPELQKIFVDPSLQLGDMVTLMCSLRRGSLPVKFRWLFNGQDITSSKPVKIQSFDKKSDLTIDEIKRSHLGNYTCVVRNSAGSDSYTAKFLVEVPPVWIEAPKDTSAAVGTKVVLDCAVSAYPEPTIIWSTDSDIKGSEFRDMKPDYRRKILQNGSLLFDPVEQSDAGLYKCFVKNGIGPGITKLATLIVSAPPALTETEKLIVAKLGSHAKLECEANGDQSMSVIWSKDGIPIHKTLKAAYDIIERERPGGISSELFIPEAKTANNGTYTCLVTSKFGNVTARRILAVLEAPSPPVGLKVSEIKPRSVKISWQPPYTEVKNFEVLYWKESAQNRKLNQVSVLGSQTYTNLGSLHPGTEYTGYVLSENAVATSGPSAPFYFTTSEETPTAPPVNVLAIPLGQDVIKVEWKAPPSEHLNGKIQGYSLGHKNKDTPVPYTYQKVTGNVETALIIGLQPSSSYTVVIRVFNSAGSGPLSHPVYVTTLDRNLPSPPMVTLVGITCCTVTLDLHKADKTNGITQYRVDYRTIKSSWKTIYFPPHALAMHLRGLRKDTSYEIKVAAYNLEGVGQPSSPLAFTTKDQGFSHGDEGDAILEVPFYLQAKVLVPVALSVGVILVSIVTACAFYRKMVVKQKPVVIYEARVQRNSWQPTREYASLARSVGRPEDPAYDVPWDVTGTTSSKAQDGNYTRLKNRNSMIESNSHLALDAGRPSEGR